MQLFCIYYANILPFGISKGNNLQPLAYAESYISYSICYECLIVGVAEDNVVSLRLQMALQGCKNHSSLQNSISYDYRFYAIAAQMLLYCNLYRIGKHTALPQNHNLTCTLLLAAGNNSF